MIYTSIIVPAVRMHIPALLGPDPAASPLFQLLAPRSGERVIDATAGLGGHSFAFARAIAPAGELTCIDADVLNLESARAKLGASSVHQTFIRANFRDIATLRLQPADILLADLGLSSPHVDDPERGFSYRHTSPLDLRFDRSRGATAAELLRTLGHDRLARAFRELGELRQPALLARALCEARASGKTPQTTDALRAIVEETYGWRAPSVLPQAFQALRMLVNDELGALSELLLAVPSLLRPGGRCGVISYHSLEDRLVKRAFRSLTTPQIDMRTGQETAPAAFVLLTRRPVRPDAAEIQRNPRVRSALFRAISRRDAGGILPS
ncbi:MAG: 16S rRNA (cytosine1402-N4)-methyltransferase [Candidatus Peregrinibacteria bacterium Greene0416_19]|nr:MAG: 16S rRNA (cytosine1402-N4)-methyltransferase [Candidatus Peregrinibacteria bacterium Greene0416_19]